MSDLTHVDDKGKVHMVDVTEKRITGREAEAHARIVMSAEAFSALMEGNAKKGEVLAAARIAAIMGAKRTSDLIPLCHQIPLTKVQVDFDPDEKSCAVNIRARPKTKAQTGVEMEAMTAVTLAALTIYDMLKAVDRTMKIETVYLVEKSGGDSGFFRLG